MRALIYSFFIVALSFTAFSNQAKAGLETELLITVKSSDAKFIGTQTGGAHVIIRNRKTGDVIADGMTYGSTGDTDTIMAQSIERDAKFTAPETAKFQFSLEFWEPTPVTISASANGVSASFDTILVPEKDYTTGNGIMIEIPGFAVDILSPAPNSSYDHNAKTPVSLEANIMHLCGCKIEPDSPWPPERYEVDAYVYKEGLLVTKFEMPYAGEPGIYASNITIPIPGIYKLTVVAFDKHNKNVGMDTTSIILKGSDNETSQESGN